MSHGEVLGSPSPTPSPSAHRARLCGLRVVAALVGLLLAGTAWGDVIWSATMTAGHKDASSDGDGHYYG